VLYSKVVKIESPAQRTITTVKGWFNKSKSGKDKCQFSEKYAISKIFVDEDDLLSLQPPAEDDRVSKYLARSSIIGWLLKV
jgi:hypothetical protein